MRPGALAVVAILATCAPPHGSGARAPAKAAKATRFDGMVVREDRPRVWLDPARVAWLRAKVGDRDVRAMSGGSAPGLALASVATGDPAHCRAATAALAGDRFAWHAAVVYDWCHAHLSPEEKARIAGALEARMNAAMADGRRWRSFHNSGHTSAFELTVEALALHGDSPVAGEALDFVKPELDDILHVLDDLFPDGEWAEGADYARHASHDTLRALLAVKTATGRDFAASSAHLRNVAPFIFYATKPNGLMFPGDDNDYPFVSAWEHRALLMIASEYRDPYAQWFLRHCPFERFRLEDKDKWEELLWGEDTIAEKALSDLPLARLFRGKGIVLARTSWDFADPSAVWLAFTNGDYFGDHDHLDVNAFQIYRGGDLAIDSGRYDDDWDHTRDPDEIGRSQLFNYYQRTIAHNTMLVFDPSERFERGLVNDGGQLHHLWRGKHRNVPEDYAQGTFPSDDGVGTSDWTTNPGRWERGDITAYGATSDWVYVRGDGTRAYAPSKVSSFVRELVFVRPRLVVVFDRVAATNPAFEKTWLLHTVDEPRITDDTFEVPYGEGRLFGIAALPRDRRLAKVGGPGNEHLVAGVHYASGPRSTLNPSALHYGETPGAWRIEERPGGAHAEDVFANVMLLTDRASTERPTVEVEQRDGVVVLRIGDDAATVGLRFTEKATSLRLERQGAVAFEGPLPGRVPPEP